MFKRIFPIIFALILLGAHFSRNGNDILAVVCVLLPVLLFIKKIWVINLLQAVAYLGSVSWATGAYALVMGRMSAGQPWLRLFVIMALIVVFTVWAGYWLKGPEVKENYK